MLYTVKEVAGLSGVTIKTLHHYHRIGLLLPQEISSAGYRLYGMKELERLQQILFYRELDFTLEQIRRLLEETPDRLSILSGQEELLRMRRQRLETVIETLQQSIIRTKKGEHMDSKEMFKGFESEAEWKEALQEQNEHLKAAYNYDLLDSLMLDIRQMNDMAAEAASFMSGMAGALQAGVKHNDVKILGLLQSHLEFLNGQGHSLSAADFVAQSRFFLNDEFHLRMLEGQQTGLAYYLLAVGEAYAAEVH